MSFLLGPVPYPFVSSLSYAVLCIPLSPFSLHLFTDSLEVLLMGKPLVTEEEVASGSVSTPLCSLTCVDLI